MAGRVKRRAREPEGRLRVPPGGGASHSPYPDFDVTAGDKWQLDWDAKTRRLVRQRVDDVPDYRFLSPDEARLIEAVCERLLPQDDRTPAERIPIAPWIDDRLARDDGDGYRYEDMPPDPEAVRRGLGAIDALARNDHHRAFTLLAPGDQDAVLGRVASGEVSGAAWHGLPAQRLFQLLLNDALSFYYAHPSAWAEIGFNGPASPRGHMRLDLGRRDPWEAAERRPRRSTDIVERAKRRGGGGGESGEATH